MSPGTASHTAIRIHASHIIKPRLHVQTVYSTLNPNPPGEPSSNEIQAFLGKITGGTSVPRVFVNGEFIGGGDDTAQKAASGELKQLIERT